MMNLLEDLKSKALHLESIPYNDTVVPSDTEFMELLFGFSDMGRNNIFNDSQNSKDDKQIVDLLLRNKLQYDDVRGKLYTNKGLFFPGWFISPRVDEILILLKTMNIKKGYPKVKVIEGKDIGAAHLDGDDGECFQGASQLNALEMINPGKTPYDGVGIYINDNTQGPRMALSCLPGTIVRNYWLTQKLGKQFNALEDMGYEHENGYLIWGEDPSDVVIDVGAVKISAMIHTQVAGITKPNNKEILGHIKHIRVHQIYSSGVPVNSYHNSGDYDAQIKIASKLLYAEYMGMIALSLILHKIDKKYGNTQLRDLKLILRW